MKAVDLLIKACSEFNRDPSLAIELFEAAMLSEDSNQLAGMLASNLSLPAGDIESLSDAASKASRRMRAKPKKAVLSFY